MRTRNFKNLKNHRGKMSLHVNVCMSKHANKSRCMYVQTLAVHFLPLSSQKFLYSFDWPWKDERLSQPWSHPVVLNTGPLDWESSTITTRPCLKYFWKMYIYFLIWIHSMQGLTATTGHGVTRKRNTKGLRHTGNLFRKNLQLKDVC